MIISEPVNNQQSTGHNPNEIKLPRRSFSSPQYDRYNQKSTYFEEAEE